MKYLIHNNNFVSADEPVLKVSNRSFRFGDSVFETIRVMGGRPLFLDEHLLRLKKGIALLKMEPDADYSSSFFSGKIAELLAKNNITTGARLRLTVFRNEGGFYTPKYNTCSYILESEPIEENEYVLNAKGYAVDIYNEVKKQLDLTSSIKTGNSLMYVMAGLYKLQHQLDDCILTNVKGHIIETINSNIFAVKNGVLYTPPVADGCVDGVMRKKLIEVAFKNRIAVYEINLAQNVLLSADELFLTNVVSGLRWIGAYKSKRYYNNTSKLLVDKLNDYVKEKKDA